MLGGSAWTTHGRVGSTAACCAMVGLFGGWRCCDAGLDDLAEAAGSAVLCGWDCSTLGTDSGAGKHLFQLHCACTLLLLKTRQLCVRI